MEIEFPLGSDDRMPNIVLLVLNRLFRRSLSYRSVLGINRSLTPHRKKSDRAILDRVLLGLDPGGFIETQKLRPSNGRSAIRSVHQQQKSLILGLV